MSDIKEVVTKEVTKSDKPVTIPPPEVAKTTENVDKIASPNDVAKAKSYLSNLATEIVDEFGGENAQPGLNPFLWVAKFIRPLQDKLAISPVMQSTVNESLALAKAQPIIDANSLIPSRLVPNDKLAPKISSASVPVKK
jgi:hypothetical protein